MGFFDFLFGSNNDSDDSKIHTDDSAGKTVPSYPHKGSTAPKEHIDTYVYKDGKREYENEKQHITDKGHVMWGQKAKEWDEKQKGKK